MLRISDFSRLTQVPAKTLRYYDEIGLLKPVHIDRFTGYRYYSAKQLPQLNRLLAYKALGLSLEQIRLLLDQVLSAEQIRDMLRLKQLELQQRIADEQQRLLLVESKLRLIQEEAQMSTVEVVLKKVAPMRVAGMRAKAPDQPSLEVVFKSMFDKLVAHIAQTDGFAGPSMVMYHDEDFPETDIDVEALIPVNATVASSAEIRVYMLEGSDLMASAIHKGAYEGLSTVGEGLARWIEDNGYRIVGANREIYHEWRGTPDEFVTEMQFPVEKT